MTLDDYDVVTAQSDVQVRNAYAAAAWRQQYDRRAQCQDPRDWFLLALAERNDMRMEAARKYVRLSERTKLAIQRALQADLNHRRGGSVVPFRERSRR